MLRFLAACLYVVLFVVPSEAATPRLELLTNPSDPGMVSVPTAVSADGKVVAGGAYKLIFQDGFPVAIERGAFRWARESGSQWLYEGPGGETLDRATDVSTDGSVIVGVTLAENGSANRAFYWSSFYGMEYLSGVQNVSALAVSADGPRVVGTGVINGISAPFTWMRRTGLSAIDDLCPASDLRAAYDVSADGHMILGALESAPAFAGAYLLDALHCEPFTAADLDPEQDRGVLLSDDSNVIAGLARLGRTGARPFRWSEADGYTQLFADDDARGTVEGISADGNAIVGLQNVPGGTTPYYWDVEHGARPLAEVLADDFGLGDTWADWTFESATGISANGKTVVGVVRSPHDQRFGYVASVPEPTGACLLVVGSVILAATSLRSRHHQVRLGSQGQ